MTHIYGLVQERRNSIANVLELGLSCTNPSIHSFIFFLYITVWSMSPGEQCYGNLCTTPPMVIKSLQLIWR